MLAPAGLAALDQERVAGESGRGEARRPDELTDPRDNGVPAGNQQPTGVPGDREQPTDQPPEKPADARATDADQAQARDREPFLQQDEPQPLPTGGLAEQPPDSGQDRLDQPAQDGPQPAPAAESSGQPAPRTDTLPGTDRPVDITEDRDRRISGEGLLPDDNVRVAHLDEREVERSVAERLKRIVGKLDPSDQHKELADTVDRPDFQDPRSDPKKNPDRYGTLLERR